MKKPVHKPGDIVCHKLNPERKGMVIAVITGFNGHTYRVTWANDFEDQSHYTEELLPEKPAAPAVGFQS